MYLLKNGELYEYVQKIFHDQATYSINYLESTINLLISTSVPFQKVCIVELFAVTHPQVYDSTLVVHMIGKHFCYVERTKKTCSQSTISVVLKNPPFLNLFEKLASSNNYFSSPIYIIVVNNNLIRMKIGESTLPVCLFNFGNTSTPQIFSLLYFEREDAQKNQITLLLDDYTEQLERESKIGPISEKRLMRSYFLNKKAVNIDGFDQLSHKLHANLYGVVVFSSRIITTYQGTICKMFLLVDETHKLKNKGGEFVLFIFSKDVNEIPPFVPFGAILNVNNVYVTQRDGFLHGSLSFNSSWILLKQETTTAMSPGTFVCESNLKLANAHLGMINKERATRLSSWFNENAESLKKLYQPLSSSVFCKGSQLVASKIDGGSESEHPFYNICAKVLEINLFPRDKVVVLTLMDGSSLNYHTHRLSTKPSLLSSTRLQRLYAGAPFDCLEKHAKNGRLFYLQVSGDENYNSAKRFAPHDIIVVHGLTRTVFKNFHKGETMVLLHLSRGFTEGRLIGRLHPFDKLYNLLITQLQFAPVLPPPPQNLMKLKLVEKLAHNKTLPSEGTILSESRRHMATKVSLKIKKCHMQRVCYDFGTLTQVLNISEKKLILAKVNCHILAIWPSNFLSSIISKCTNCGKFEQANTSSSHYTLDRLRGQCCTSCGKKTVSFLSRFYILTQDYSQFHLVFLCGKETLRFFGVENKTIKQIVDEQSVLDEIEAKIFYLTSLHSQNHHRMEMALLGMRPLPPLSASQPEPPTTTHYPVLRMIKTKLEPLLTSQNNKNNS